ncbi:MAG: hypothetical protein SFU85_10235 [Candidatus Methylacidiphilales bacterium]|nr:hypothetical protein [Candidatus Methylacidiphilales bacterium]
MQRVCLEGLPGGLGGVRIFRLIAAAKSILSPFLFRGNRPQLEGWRFGKSLKNFKKALTEKLKSVCSHLPSGKTEGSLERHQRVCLLGKFRWKTKNGGKPERSLNELTPGLELGLGRCEDSKTAED